VSRSSPVPAANHHQSSPQPNLSNRRLPQSSPIRHSDPIQPCPSVPGSDRCHQSSPVPAANHHQSSPQPNLSNRRLPQSSPIRRSDLIPPRPSVPGSNRHHQSSPGPASTDRNPSHRHLNHLRASSICSNQENYPPAASHDDIYDLEEVDEDPQVSRRRHDNPLVSRAQANGEGDEEDWTLVRHPIPDLPDDEAPGHRPETISRPLGPRRLTLTLKVPQKRVRHHVTF